MDVIIGLAVLFAIGWAISRSKFLSNLLDGLGLAMNWLWGSLCVGGGIWGLFNGWGFWSLVCIGVGIYFFTPGRFDKKVEDAAQGFIEDLSDKVVDRLGAAPVSTPGAATESAYVDAGSTAGPKRPSRKLVLLVIGIVGIAYGMWGLQNAGEVTTTYTFDGGTPGDYGIKSTTDIDMGGALPWVALLGGGAAIAVAQAIERRDKREQAESPDAPDVTEPASVSSPVSADAMQVASEPTVKAVAGADGEGPLVDQRAFETPVSRTVTDDRVSLIESMKQALRQSGPPYPARDLYNLGRAYALLFDQTSESKHRAAALKYMNAASDIDPDLFDPFLGPGDLEAFGSLMNDAEFSEFS